MKNWQDIAKEFDTIKSVKVIWTTVIVNDKNVAKYTYREVAKAVADKLRNLIEPQPQKKMFLHIKNPKTGLKKIVDATDYTIEELEKAYNAYQLNANYDVFMKSYKRADYELVK